MARVLFLRLAIFCCSTGLLPFVLTGCGGKPDDGGSTTTTATTSGGPPHPSGKETVDCPKDMVRKHCTGQCVHDWDADTWTCKECEAPYKLGSDNLCEVKCSDLPKPKERPGVPANARDLDGVSWPDACWDDSEENYWLVIGDWGGICGWPNSDPSDPTVDVCATPEKAKAWRPQGTTPGKPFPMDTYKRMGYIDQNGQALVADKMMDKFDELKKAGSPPRFILNLGDSFYPGGIDEHCSNKNGADLSEIIMKYQFKTIFEDMYTSKDADFNKLEWWGVLGNHDYGGNCYVKAWDQIIFYTWKPDGRWVLPAPYWHRHVQFKRTDVDFFFIDTNILDVEPPMGNPKQNICYQHGNDDSDDDQDHCHTGHAPEGQIFYPPTRGAPAACPATKGPMSPDDCVGWFHTMWNAIKKWLDDGLKNSKADWQIVVHHYPVKNSPPSLDWTSYSAEHGIDLVVTAHQHFQKIYFESPIEDMPQMNLGPTPHVVSGGGGGIQTDKAPNAQTGIDDSYGYMLMKLTNDELEIEAYSHGIKLLSDGGKQILRNSTKSKYVERKAASESSITV